MPVVPPRVGVPPTHDGESPSNRTHPERTEFQMGTHLAPGPSPGSAVDLDLSDGEQMHELKVTQRSLWWGARANLSLMDH